MQGCFAELEQRWEKANLRRKGLKFGFDVDQVTRNLTNLRFADDVVLFSQHRSDIAKMLGHLRDAGLKYGLEINFDKTKVLTWNAAISRHPPVKVGEESVDVLAEGDFEKYLGRRLSLDFMHETELENRIRAGWASFHKHKAELCTKTYCLPDRLRLFNAVVTPVVLYACSTWALKTGMERQLRTAWRRMLRYVFGIHRLNAADGSPEPWVEFVQRAAHKVEELALKFGIESWVEQQRRRKWRFAGRLARLDDGRWSKIVLNWTPAGVRNQQRPRTRWADQLAQFAGGSWQEVASDPATWQALEEGFVCNL